MLTTGSCTEVYLPAALNDPDQYMGGGLWRNDVEDSFICVALVADAQGHLQCTLLHKFLLHKLIFIIIIMMIIS